MHYVSYEEKVEYLHVVTSLKCQNTIIPSSDIAYESNKSCKTLENSIF